MSKIDELRMLATEMKEIERYIKTLEYQLENAKEKHYKLSAEQIPIVMAEIGMKSFTLEDGTRFNIVPIFQVRVLKDKIDKADEWLANNGHGGMVKTNFDVSKQNIDWVKVVLEEQGIKYTINKSIHHSTLTSWGKEMEINGMVIPEDIFSIYRSNKTVID